MKWAEMLKSKIWEFLRLTSVKGIPRLLRTSSRFMKLIWGVSIVCFLVTAAYQATMLTKAYLDYATVTSIRELPIDLVGQSDDSVNLPVITFCNLNPFASNFTNDPDILSIQDYITEVQQMAVCVDCTNSQKLIISQLRDELMTTRGYYVQIGNDQAKRIGQQADSLFASCNVWVKSGMHLNYLPCEGFIDMKLHQDSRFFNCFTVRPEVEQTKERTFIGVILVFHLDDYAIRNYPYTLHVTPHIGYANGVVFTYHDRGTPPLLTRKHMLLQPGLFSDIKVRIKRRKRLAEPYGECVIGAGEDNEFIKTGPYSQFMCFAICRQAMVLDMCGCIDYDYYMDALTHTEGRACLKLEHGRERLVKEWNCLQQARNISATRCADKCPLPCDEVTFEEKMTHTTWPSSHLQAFYQEYINNRTYATHYQSILDSRATNHGVTEDLRVDKLLGQHFLALQMYLDETTMMEYTDHPKLSFIGLISHLGGALNLWAGVTIVVVIEIIELLFELVKGEFGNGEKDNESQKDERDCSDEFEPSNDPGDLQMKRLSIGFKQCTN